MMPWTGSRASLRVAVPGVRARASLIATGMGLATALAVAAPAPAAPPLKKGSVITAPYKCSYLPGARLDGMAYPRPNNGFTGLEEEGVYLITGAPDLPGGHWEIHGQYPKANYFGIQANSRYMINEGFIDGKDIPPDPGSVNPWQPGNRYEPGRNYFTLRIEHTPFAERKNPPPPGVFYVGYRNGPPGRLAVANRHQREIGIMQTIAGGAGDTKGGVPLATYRFVVDDPAKNIIRDSKHLCTHMISTVQPWQTLMGLSDVLLLDFANGPQAAFLKKQFFPSFMDPTSGQNGEPYVNVFRPSSAGYWLPMWPAAADYVWTAPNPKYGKFFVIRFKAPTTSHVAQGIPNTGKEQEQYWTWCGIQSTSLLINRVGKCLSSDEVDVDSQGYVTIAVSPEHDRPVINGTPYKDWLVNPGGGGLFYQYNWDANPETYPQAGYFAPQNLSQKVPIWDDWVRGRYKGPQLKQHMGEYHPQVYYCTRQKFEAAQCAPPSGG